MGAAALGVTVAGAAMSAYGQAQAGKAQSNYYSYLAGTSRTNAGLAEAEGVAQGRQINAQAFQEQRLLNDRVSKTVGSQKASLADGAGASSRTAQDIIGDTINEGELDQEALNYNTNTKSRNAGLSADMQAFNYNNQASGDQFAGRNAMATAKLGEMSSLLGGASSVAKSYWMADLYSGRMNQSNLNQ